MEVLIIASPITKGRLNEIAKEGFGDMVKGVVDLEEGLLALGGELHADEEAVLLEQGSVQENLWGINLYPDLTMPDMLEYDSMITSARVKTTTPGLWKMKPSEIKLLHS